MAKVSARACIGKLVFLGRLEDCPSQTQQQQWVACVSRAPEGGFTRSVFGGEPGGAADQEAAGVTPISRYSARRCRHQPLFRWPVASASCPRGQFVFP